MELKFRTREKIEEMIKIAPNEKLDAIVDVLNQVTVLGWDFHQWGTTIANYEKKDVLEKFPMYDECTKEEKEQILDEFSSQLPEIYFIESFGNKTHGMLRTEKATLLECAKACLRRAEIMINCHEHNQHIWKYTHHNGHKTCEKCGTFTKCTVEEAVNHYEKGYVELDKFHSLYFHQTKCLCTVCGSRQLIRNDASILNKKQFQCPVCHTYYPQKFEDTKYSSLPIEPYEDAYETATEYPKEKRYVERRLHSLGLASISFVDRQIQTYFQDILKHFMIVEKRKDIDNVQEWARPYLEKFVENSRVQLKENEKRYHITGIKNLNLVYEKEQFKKLDYELIMEETQEKKPTPEQLFTRVLSHLHKNIGKSE